MGEALVNSYLYGKTPWDQIFNAGMFRTPAAPYSRGQSEVGLSHWTTPYFLWPDKVKDDPLGVLFKVFRALTCFLVINYLVNFTFYLFFLCACICWALVQRCMYEGQRSACRSYSVPPLCGFWGWTDLRWSSSEPSDWPLACLSGDSCPVCFLVGN